MDAAGIVLPSSEREGCKDGSGSLLLFESFLFHVPNPGEGLYHLQPSPPPGGHLEPQDPAPSLIPLNPTVPTHRESKIFYIQRGGGSLISADLPGLCQALVWVLSVCRLISHDNPMRLCVIIIIKITGSAAKVDHPGHLAGQLKTQLVGAETGVRTLRTNKSKDTWERSKPVSWWSVCGKASFSR